MAGQKSRQFLLNQRLARIEGGGILNDARTRLLAELGF